jgi:heme exporter protein B
MNEPPSALTAFSGLLRRDLLLAVRNRGELLTALLFFVIVVTLFPLGVTPELDTLRRVAAGVIWVAALLSSLLSLDGLFRTDFEDGALEQLLVCPQPLAFMVLAKVAAHWLVTGLPLIMALPGEAVPVLAVTLALGTPILSLVGAIGVALTVGVRRGGGLLSLLVLPLYVPVLVFGASAVGAATLGMPVAGQLYVLGALLALALSLAPIAAAAALRISMS